jgi:hypothetical protein
MTEGTGQGAKLTQMACKAACVNAHNGRDAVLYEEGFEPHGGTPVGGHRGQITGDDAAAPRSQCFVVERCNPVVADVRVGEANDLTGVARVGNDFLVATEGRVEDELTGGHAIFSEMTRGVSLEDRAVGQHENCGWADHCKTPSWTTRRPLTIVLRTRPTRGRP